MADFIAGYNPDVLSCLANLSNDEVFTPPDVANAMLDMLPQELFRDPETKFLDPACKSGVFLREIAKRLLEGQIPGYKENLSRIDGKKSMGEPLDEADEAFQILLQRTIDHIFHEQLYGIAITELTSLLSRRSLYCSKYPNSKYSVTAFDDTSGNIRFKNVKHRWKNGKCVFCGASEKEYKRENDLETHAYELIHTTKPEEILKMKFDVIISNPPYQLSDGGQKASATPIYQLFIKQSKKLNPRFMSFIIPARWFSGGRGLDDFRDEMLNDTRVRQIVDYTDSEDCFPGVDIAGGICYFLWDRDNRGTCEVNTLHNNKSTVSNRILNEYPIFIRHNQALSIIEKVTSNETSFYNQRVSSQKPFGLRTYVKPTENGDIILRYNGGSGPFWRKDVLQSTEWIDKWKVIMSYLTYDHAGRADKDGRRKVFSTMEVLSPQTVCTETYLVVDAFSTEQEANNLYKYLQTIFVRFLVAQTTSTQHISKANFSFVPVQDFTQQWTDEKLYKKYKLTEEEISFIESMIKPME